MLQWHLDTISVFNKQAAVFTLQKHKKNRKDPYCLGLWRSVGVTSPLSFQGLSQINNLCNIPSVCSSHSLVITGNEITIALKLFFVATEFSLYLRSVIAN